MRHSDRGVGQNKVNNVNSITLLYISKITAYHLPLLAGTLLATHRASHTLPLSAAQQPPTPTTSLDMAPTTPLKASMSPNPRPCPWSSSAREWGQLIEGAGSPWSSAPWLASYPASAAGGSGAARRCATIRHVPRGGGGRQTPRGRRGRPCPSCPPTDPREAHTSLARPIHTGGCLVGCPPLPLSENESAASAAPSSKRAGRCFCPSGRLRYISRRVVEPRGVAAFLFVLLPFGLKPSRILLGLSRGPGRKPGGFNKQGPGRKPGASLHTLKRFSLSRAPGLVPAHTRGTVSLPLDPRHA